MQVRKQSLWLNPSPFKAQRPHLFSLEDGYPNVAIGPMIPPMQGDTSFIDTPETWVGKSIDDIVDFRMKLVRGKYRTSIHNFSGKVVEFTREVALARKPVDMEVLQKKAYWKDCIV